MRRILAVLLVVAVSASARAADEDKSQQGSTVSLAQRAADRLKAGDKDGACADAKAALAENQADDAAYAVAQSACTSANLPSKAKYTPKTKLKKFESASGPSANIAPLPPPETPPANPQAAPSGEWRTPSAFGDGGPLPPGAAGAAGTPQAAPADGTERPPAQGEGRPSAPAGTAEPKWYEGGPKLEAGVVVPEKPVQADPMLEASAQMTAAAGAKLEVGDPREAIRLATEAIESNPHNPRAFLVRGVAQRAKKQCRAAAADADAGLALRPNDLLLLRLKADALNCARDFRAALETADKVLVIDPTDARAYALKAWALKGLGDEEGMAAELKKAAAISPAYEYTLASVGRMKDDPEVFFLYPGESPPRRKEDQKRAGGLGKTGRMAIAGGFAILTFIGFMIGIAQWARSRSAQAAGAAPEEGKGVPRFVPAPQAPGRLAAGAKLAGRYEVEDLLGEGATGAVYSGFDRKLSRVVAIRVLRPELCASAGEAGRFLEAADKLALPNHPGIVGFFDAFSEGGAVFLVNDYVDGKPISRMIETSKGLPFVDVLAIALQACQALDCAHRAGVVHGDLKPGNILIDKRGGVRLSDFRLSRMAKDALARLGVQAGARASAHLAPEQHGGSSVPASDVYSFGLCLYEMLTGAPAFRGGSLGEKTSGTFASCKSLAPDLPKGLDEVLAEVLKADPGQRLSEPMQFMQRLQSLR